MNIEFQGNAYNRKTHKIKKKNAIYEQLSPHPWSVPRGRILEAFYRFFCWRLAQQISICSSFFFFFFLKTLWCSPTVFLIWLFRRRWGYSITSVPPLHPTSCSHSLLSLHNFVRCSSWYSAITAFVSPFHPENECISFTPSWNNLYTCGFQFSVSNFWGLSVCICTF